ncbi:hypothetical protein F5Y15DRAFT_133119 [Xylariaceae sp. FL0016]|nr:hypothetical protein F5Y15DRAFT_133119 [Xylariaceae sp. FL0016]
MPSTLLPFLYQTRTILRLHPRAPAIRARSLHATCRPPQRVQRVARSAPYIPFDSEVADEDAPMEFTHRGTITPSERQVFERIFADIKARGLKPAVSEDGPEPSLSSGRTAQLIMQEAAQDVGQSGHDTVVSPALLAGAAKSRNKALLRFPPELRAAASKALGNVTYHAPGMKFKDDIPYEIATGEDPADAEWNAPAHSFERTVELEAKRHPERQRIEKLINDAKTDFELWDMLEKEVFTMPAKLGIATSTEDGDAVSSRPADPSKSTPAGLQHETINEAAQFDQATEVKEGVSSEEGIPETSGSDAYADATPITPQKLSLYVHGPLYPAYLLLALRKFGTGFHAPSPLAFSLLPRIKQLGLASYVLGVSTAFYNELLDLTWTRRGDLSGMLDLLEEMRHCGLYFDAKTASLLHKADNVISQMSGTQTKSDFGRAIMEMPEYEKSVRSRLRHWHSAVNISISEKKQDIGYSI